MRRPSEKLTVVLALSLTLGAALMLAASTAVAQSSGGTSGGVGAGAGAGRASAGAGAGAIGGTMGRAPGMSAPPGDSSTSGAANDTSGAAVRRVPGTLVPGDTFTPGGTLSPSGTAPSGAALEAARQRALQSPAGTPIPPSTPRVGAGRSGTAESDSSGAATQAATPGLTDQAPPDRNSGDPARLTAGGSTNRQGAVGKTMAECEAAWDAATHMSKQTWRDTCRRTLTAPHL